MGLRHLALSALLLITGARNASTETLSDLLSRAGNASSDAARLLVLRELVEHPELTEVQRGEAQKLSEAITRYKNDPNLYYFSREVLDTENYDFGVTEDSPLYPLTHLYRGRMLVWTTMEYGGYWSKPDVKRKRLDSVRSIFEAAHATFPEEPLAPMYLGEALPPTFVYPAPSDAPAWAVSQREGLERLTDIIHWWIANRLRADGQYGGGWGDDCEMWRWWVPILMGFQDPEIEAAQAKFSTALLGQKHMRRGYTEHVYDVEHTSEDSSDAMTPMLHLVPESEAWQGRALRLVELSKGVWMGRNERDQLQFKSTYFSVDKVDESAKRACDTVYHPRALQPALLLWQRTHDPELTGLFTDWMDTWVDAAARTERGKPAGVIPSAVHWPDGNIGGIGANWWDPENHSRDPLYVFPSAMSQMTHTLLLTYHVTGDDAYLAPIRSMAALRLAHVKEPPEEAPQPGSAPWCAARMGSLSSVLSKYRLLTGNTEFDDLLRASAAPYARYRFWGGEDDVISALNDTAAALGVNFRGYTSEVRYTDRVLRLPRLFATNGMYPDAVEEIRQPDTALLYATVTGDPGTAGYFPLNAVRWLTPARNIAAFLTDSGTGVFEARLYHFGDTPRTMGAELYMLAPGQYVMHWDGTKTPLTVKGPQTRIEFTLPPQKELVLRVAVREG